MSKKFRVAGEYPKTDFAVMFDDNGNRYMRCQNSVPDGKYWKGYFCNSWIRVGDNAVSAVCYKCVQMLLDPVVTKKSTAMKSDKPKGWKFMNEFVDKDGTVYFKGIEQPDLKNTRPITVIPEKEPKKKLSKEEKARMIEELGVEIKRLKNQLMVETKKGKKAELTRSLTKANKSLKKLI